MVVYLASDHAAFPEKSELAKFIASEFGFEVIDLGTDSDQSTNYSEFAIKLAKSVQKDANSKGVLLCGSGIGVSMAANRFRGVRAARCLSEYDAEMSRKHNNANVICLAGRITPIEDMKKMLKIWFATDFEGGRHQTRIDLFDSLGC
ncbi:MAG: ribose 5-phosphate isomerase B [Halobacteriovoraceae bacterium]|nr:ribose 5-phosphate isomerase B [Halobacteriovoraceae bacterium]